MRRPIILSLALAAPLAVSAALAPGAAAQDGVVCVGISVFGTGTSFCVPTDDDDVTLQTNVGTGLTDGDDACTFRSHVSQTGDANTSRSVVTVSTTCRTDS
ncbi:MAG: hypothetical protein M3Q10_18515 [Chloroflexota bacterium]|nr:hypothetical protein [Chloroflexota bacterium]